MRKKKTRYDLLVLFFFLIVSTLMVFPFIRTGNLEITNDGVFHLQRINEVYTNLKNGHFTSIATHTFSRIGLASFEFYPSVFLYPWAALRFIFKPVTAFYVGCGILFFITLTIAYFSMMRFSNKNLVRSVSFALIYGLSGKYLTEFAKFQIGEMIAYSFLPIVFLGFYEIVFSNNSKGIITLAIGLTLVAYSHVLTTYLCIMLMIILFVIALLRNFVDCTKLVSLIKSAVLFLLLAIWQYVPFISNNFSKAIAPPGFSFWPIQASDIWNASWSNNISSDLSIGIILVIILVFGWIAVNNNREKWIYALGVFICVITTTLFPWRYVAKTALIKLFIPLQFSFRFLPLAVLFLSVTGSLMVEKIVKKSKLYIPVLMVIIFGSYVNAVKPLINNIQKNNIVFLSNKKNSDFMLPPAIIVNNETYNSIDKYIAPLGSVDYITKAALNNNNYRSIQNHEAIVGGVREKTNARCEANKIVFDLYGKKGQKVDLPVIKYNRMMVTINNKNVSSKISYRGSVKIKLLRTGKQIIKVYYKPTVLFYALLTVAILSWLFICVYLFRKRELYEKNS